MPVCRWLFACLLCVLAVPLSAAERADPRQAVAQLLPALRHLDFVWEQAEGDLNGDGIADVAMLFRGRNRDDTDIEERLVVLAGTPAGDYRVLSVSGEFCRPSKFYNMVIQRGSLLVEVVETADGGRWGSNTMRFRYNSDLRDLQLIGEDTRSEDYESGEQERSSTNLLTGKYISTTRIKGKTKTSTRQLTVTSRPTLNGWACNG